MIFNFHFYLTTINLKLIVSVFRFFFNKTNLLIPFLCLCFPRPHKTVYVLFCILFCFVIFNMWREWFYFLLVEIFLTSIAISVSRFSMFFNASATCLLVPCLAMLVISCCEYFLFSVNRIIFICSQKKYLS